MIKKPFPVFTKQFAIVPLFVVLTVIFFFNRTQLETANAREVWTPGSTNVVYNRDTLTHDSLMKAVDTLELRQDTEAKAAACGIDCSAEFSGWSQTDLATGRTIRGRYIQDLRNCLKKFYGGTRPSLTSVLPPRAEAPLGGFQDDPIDTASANPTPARAAHVIELRIAFASAQCCGDLTCDAAETSLACPGDCSGGCSAQTLSNCNLPAASNGTTAGTCTASGACSYTCTTGTWILNSNTCSAGFVCIGSTPSNATICSGDDIGLIADTVRSVGASCTAAKCEYTCNPGYTFSSGVCQQDCSAQTLSNCSLSASIHNTTTGTCAASGSCSYTCNNGTWNLNSNTCTACSCSGWESQGCGFGGCDISRDYQTQTCNPPGCAAESQCYVTPPCAVLRCASDCAGWGSSSGTCQISNVCPGGTFFGGQCADFLYCCCQCVSNGGSCGSNSACCSGNCSSNTCAPATFSCTGTIPSNATICSGDDTGLAADTPRTLVAACTATKCEYTCNAGYTLSGGVCQQDCSATTINNCNLPVAIHNATAGTCTASGSCSYTCNNGTWNVNSNSCTGFVCGNGIVEGAEQCDTGGSRGSCPATCSLACTNNSCPVCGNGIVEGAEQCDTGGSRGSCPATCSLACTNNSCPVCGNGIREGTEQCDSGAGNSDTVRNACRTTCKNPWCGDTVCDAPSEVPACTADCLFCLRDADSDGVGQGSTFVADARTGCPVGWGQVPPGDCCDTDNRAKPGQTTYFSAPNNCGNYNYDCNGTTNRYHGTGVGSCGPTADANCGDTCPGACQTLSTVGTDSTGNPYFGWQFAAPACGGSAIMYLPPSFGPTYTACFACNMNSSTTEYCR